MARTPEQIIGKDRLLQLIFEGYAIVPAAPTAQMLAAGNVCCMEQCIDRHGVEKVWKAMLAKSDSF